MTVFSTFYEFIKSDKKNKMSIKASNSGDSLLNSQYIYIWVSPEFPGKRKLAFRREEFSCPVTRF